VSYDLYTVNPQTDAPASINEFILQWSDSNVSLSEQRVRSFVHSLRAGVQLTLEPSAETFISVQCASPGRGELVGVCSVCARCVGWRKEQ